MRTSVRSSLVPAGGRPRHSRRWPALLVHRIPPPSLPSGSSGGLYSDAGGLCPPLHVAKLVIKRFHFMLVHITTDNHIHAGENLAGDIETTITESLGRF